MADSIRKVSYRYVTIPDRPGEGARVLDALKEAGVNLLAFHAFPSEGQSQLDLFASDEDALTAAARGAGFELSAPKNAFLVEGEDRPGAARDILGKLTGAGINAIAMSASASGGRYSAVFWVPQEDYERAAEAMGAQ